MRLKPISDHLRPCKHSSRADFFEHAHLERVFPDKTRKEIAFPRVKTRGQRVVRCKVWINSSECRGLVILRLGRDNPNQQPLLQTRHLSQVPSLRPAILMSRGVPRAIGKARREEIDWVTFSARQTRVKSVENTDRLRQLTQSGEPIFRFVSTRSFFRAICVSA